MKNRKTGGKKPNENKKNKTNIKQVRVRDGQRLDWGRGGGGGRGRGGGVLSLKQKHWRHESWQAVSQGACWCSL